jgi:protein gp37
MDVFEPWTGPVVDTAGGALWNNEDVPRHLSLIDVRSDLLNLMYRCRSLDWLLLTKRPKAMYDWIGGASGAGWSEWQGNYPHVWLGVSVENQAAADERIPLLLKCPAAVRFVSIEPMLGPIDLSRWLESDEWAYCCACGRTGYVGQEWECSFCGDPRIREGRTGLHLAIAGGESGPDARPMHPDWPRTIRDQCVVAGVPFFFKQWGGWAPFEKRHSGPLASRNRLFDGDHFVKWRDGQWVPNLLSDSGEQVMLRVGKKAAGRLLDGREWSQLPDSYSNL